MGRCLLGTEYSVLSTQQGAPCVRPHNLSVSASRYYVRAGQSILRNVSVNPPSSKRYHNLRWQPRPLFWVRCEPHYSISYCPLPDRGT
jgi:hypothetical protein